MSGDEASGQKRRPGHRPWSEIRETKLAGLSPEERAAHDAEVGSLAAQLKRMSDEFRITCRHPGRAPLFPDTPDDLHCTACGQHLSPRGACPAPEFK